jgi:hypothetical protein
LRKRELFEHSCKFTFCLDYSISFPRFAIIITSDDFVERNIPEDFETTGVIQWNLEKVHHRRLEFFVNIKNDTFATQSDS